MDAKDIVMLLLTVLTLAASIVSGMKKTKNMFPAGRPAGIPDNAGPSRPGKPVPRMTVPSCDNTENAIHVEHARKDEEVSLDPAIEDIRDNFDIKKAVLYKEILEPKFKQY